MPDVIEEEENQTEETVEDEIEQIKWLSNGVVNPVCKKCGRWNDACIPKQETHTIYDDHPQAFPSNSMLLGVVNDHTKNGRFSFCQKPVSHSQLLDQQALNDMRKFHVPTARYARHKKNTLKRKKICSSRSRILPGLLRQYNNYEDSLDALYRPPKTRRTNQSSIMQIVATGIYEISRILKDGLVRLVARNEETDYPVSKHESHSYCQVPEDLQNEKTESEMRWDSNEDEIFTDHIWQRNNDDDLLTGDDCSAEKQKETNPASSSASSLLSSTSLQNAFTLTEDDDCVEKQANNKRRDNSETKIVRLNQLDQKSYCILPAVNVDVEKMGLESENELPSSTDETDYDSTNRPTTIPEELWDGSDESENISTQGEIEDSNSWESGNRIDSEFYSDENELRLMGRNRVGKAALSDGLRNQKCVDPRGKFEILGTSAKRDDRRRSSCSGKATNQKYCGKKYTKAEYKSERAYGTFDKTRLEYFKEVESEEMTLEPESGPPCSKIPRLVRRADVEEGRTKVSNSQAGNVQPCRDCGLESSGVELSFVTRIKSGSSRRESPSQITGIKKNKHTPVRSDNYPYHSSTAASNRRATIFTCKY